MICRTRGLSIRNLRTSLLLAAMSAAGLVPAQGQTIASWVNPVSGSWTDATKWSTTPYYPNLGNPAGASYNAFIDAIGSYTVTMGGNPAPIPIEINQLTLNSDGARVVQSGVVLRAGSLSVQKGAYYLRNSAILGQSITVATGAQFVVDGTSESSIIGADLVGNLLVTAPRLNLYGNWSLTGTLSLSNAWLNAAEGTFTTASIERVNVNTGTVEIQGTVENTGDTIALDSFGAYWPLRGEGTVFGGTVTAVAPTGLVLPLDTGASSARPRATFDSVTLATDLRIESNARVSILNGIDLGGSTIRITKNFASTVATLDSVNTATISGAGEIVFDGDDAGGSEIKPLAGTLTIGPNVTIRSGTGGGVLGGATSHWINQGTISARGANRWIGAYGDHWTNTGTLEAKDGGQLSLSGTFTTAGMGHFQSSNAGTIWIAGTLDNTAAVLSLVGASESLRLNGTIRGGTIAQPQGGATLTLQSGTLENVTLSAAMMLESERRMRVRNGLTLAGGTISVAHTYSSGAPATPSVLDLNFGQSIDGTGQIVFDGTTGINLITVANGTTVFGPGVTLRTGAAGGTIGIEQGYAAGGFVNQGTISAQTTDKWLNLAGNWTNLGTFSVSAGTLALGGTFTTAGIGKIARTGGFIELAGYLDNSGSTLTIDNSTGDLRLVNTGTIHSGTIRTVGASKLVVGRRFNDPINNTLDGVTIDGLVQVVDSSYLTITNDLQLMPGSSIDLQATSLILAGTQQIGGAGEVVMNGTGGGYVGAITPTGTLTIGSGVHIRTGLQGGTIGTTGSGTGSYGLVNLGTISAQTAGKTLSLQGRWSNQGVINVSDGTLAMRGFFATADIGQINHTGGEVVIAGALDNTASTLALNHATGSFLVNNGTITGGTVASGDGAALVIVGTSTLSPSRFDGVTLDTDLYLRPGSALHLTNAPPLTGHTIHMNGGSIGSYLRPSGAASLTGVGTIIFDGGNCVVDRIPNSTSTPTIGPDIVIRSVGGGGAIGSGSSIINQGLIRAEHAGGSILYFWGRNEGVIEADPGWLTIANTTNVNTIRAVNGGSITLAGSTANLGTISVDNGMLMLTGSFTTLGTVRVSNGTLGIQVAMTPAAVDAIEHGNSVVSLYGGGSINNAGATISMSSASPWELRGGAVSSGAIASTDGTALRVWNSGLLDGVLIQSPVSVESGPLRLLNAWHNNGTITVNGGSVQLGSTFLPSDIGTIVRNAGSIVLIGTLDNSGNNLDLTTRGWGMSLAGGRINGGTVTGANLQRLEITGGGTLDGVHLTSPVFISGSTLNILNGLTLDDTVTVGRTLSFQGSQTLFGHGSVLFHGGSVPQSAIYSSGGTLSLSPDILVRTGTGSGTVGLAGSTVVNQGTISAQTSARRIAFAGTFTNLGTVEARNGGTLTLPTTLTNYAAGTLTGGRWAVYAGSSITFGTATITTNRALVLLDGLASRFDAVSPVDDNQGTFQIDHGRSFTTVGSLTNSGAIVIGSASTLNVGEAFNNTGTVDLHGVLVVDYAGASPMAGLVSQFGTNILTTEASRSIGYAEASALGVATFGGVAVDTTAALLKLTYPGDTNLDGQVDITDLAALATAWQTAGSWINGDSDYSGFIDMTDLAALAMNWQAGVPVSQLMSFAQAMSSVGLGGVEVPEPGMLALLAAWWLTRPSRGKPRRSQARRSEARSRV